VAAEFDPRSLSEPDLFIALEAYNISETERSTGRDFTSATERSSYDEGTWRTASDLWNAKPEAEKEAIKRKWESDYEQLNKSTSANSFMSACLRSSKDKLPAFSITRRFAFCHRVSSPAASTNSCPAHVNRVG
jgi:hypothetical protein